MLILDANLSYKLVPWLKAELALDALHLVELRSLEMVDRDIFFATRSPENIILTKDADFVDLVTQFGPPPRVVLLNVGNASNQLLREILRAQLPSALSILAQGHPYIEIG